MSAEGKSTVLLEHYLKQLRLPTILREYASVAAACAKDRCDFPMYLLRLVERELIDREKRAAQRRIKDARFPLIKTLDTFDFKAQPSINQSLVRELMTGEYVDRHENVILVGNSGTGKTHIASALAFSACMQGRRVRFFTVGVLGHRTDRSSGAVPPATIVVTTGAVRSSRAGICPIQSAQIRVAVRGHQSCVRAGEPDRDDEPALRAVDRGVWIRSPHRGDTGPAHAPGPHPRSQW